MKHPKFPRTARAFEAYGPNLYAQSQKTGIPYTTLREWMLYGRAPNPSKFSQFPDLLTAFAEDVAAQAATVSEVEPEPADVAA